MIQKILIGAVLIMAGAIVFQYYTIQRERNDHKEAQNKTLNKIIESRAAIIDSVQKKSLKEAQNAQEQINELKQYSNNLLTRVRNYEKNPNYDIDFLAAFDIITKSEYKPGQ